MTPSPMHIEPAVTSSSRSTPLLSLQQGDGLEKINITSNSSTTTSSNCCSDYWNESVWPGLGLFGESYILFSIGTLRPIWQVLFPDCLASDADSSNTNSNNDSSLCSDSLLHSLSYSVVAGVISGMLVIGYCSNYTGRRIGSITTAAIMFTGACLLLILSVVLTNNPVALFRCMSIALFIFGIGVGGEYPLAASSASEKAMGAMQRNMQLQEQQQQQQQQHEQQAGQLLQAIQEERSHATGTTTVTGPRSEAATTTTTATPRAVQSTRGRQIQLVFTMQGMGIFFNSVVMTLLLFVTGQTGQDNSNNQDDDNAAASYNAAALLAVWRISYLIGAVILGYVLVSRYKYLAESSVWLDDKNRRQELAARNRNNAALAAAAAANNGNNIDFTSPGISACASGLSMVSSVSSLSAPSIAQHDLDYDDDDDDDHGNTIDIDDNNDNIYMIQQVPSTDPNDNNNNSSNNNHVVRLLLRNYGVRLLGVSLSWMLWDVAFYGNKLFQSSFLLTLTGAETTLLEFSLAATLNSAVALAGYFGAAGIIDHPSVGRRRLQQTGFLLTGSLFVGVGFLYDQLPSAVLVVMYLGSSFFGQLGPNATTFLIPAEVFPTEMRTMCHGIAAASGKVGALVAAILFNYISDLDMFLISGYASFAACAVTFWTIPETNGLDLYEIDRKWRMTLDGRKSEYQGDANRPKFLSYYERNKLSMQSSMMHEQSAHSYDHDGA